MKIENRMIAFEKQLLEMSVLIQNAMKQATIAFMNLDKQLALSVIEGDIFINYTEKNINDKATEIITLMQPVAKDLRLLVGGIKIATDLERIGDYAKNISRFVINSETSDAYYRDEILKLTNIFLNNFKQVLAVLEKRDLEEAYRIAKLDAELDLQYESFSHFIVNNIFAEPLFPVELVAIAGNIQRAGDHSKNICEQIIYIINGTYIDFG